VDATLATFGGLDIIVNNAGYTWDNVIQKTTDDQFQAMLNIHLVAPFRILRAASTHIRETAKRETAEGRRVMRKVVNITSIAGTDGGAGQAGYSSGKAGVIGLTKTMAKEWGRYNVNVNAVGFGMIETRLTQPLTSARRHHRRAGPPDRRRRAAQNARSAQIRLPAGPRRHARGSRRRRAVLLLAALRLCDRRSIDLRRRNALLMCRLLIADDDVQQLGIRKLLLEAAGHEVAVAEDAPEARRLLEELRPDVLVMDLRLPKLKDGLSLIRCVGEQPPDSQNHRAFRLDRRALRSARREAGLAAYWESRSATSACSRPSTRQFLRPLVIFRQAAS
jgi:NAD(P)-dependent dehydrogenase (short-subunit alcohol dehydrogenase family)/CheY-like chemotaxis protein